MRSALAAVVAVLLAVGAAVVPAAGQPVEEPDLSPVELFVERVGSGRIAFTAIDPDDLGNPDAEPRAVAVLTHVPQPVRAREDLPDDDPEVEPLPGPDRNRKRLRFVGKYLQAVGKGIGGFIAGVAVGAPVGGAIGGAAGCGVGSLPGGVVGGAVGGAAGGICGYIGGCSIGVGDAIEMNTRGSNPDRTQDIVFFEVIALLADEGEIDLRERLARAIMSDPQTVGLVLPGGAAVFHTPESSFQDGGLLDVDGVEVAGGTAEVAVVDLDGDAATTFDHFIAVVFQDLDRGVELTDRVALPLDALTEEGALPDGPVRTVSGFAQTWDGAAADSPARRSLDACELPPTGPSGALTGWLMLLGLVAVAGGWTLVAAGSRVRR